MLMKKLLLFLPLLLLAGFSSAQDVEAEDVPSVVKLKVKALYPGVDPEETDWSLENDRYTAALEVQDKDVEVVLSSKGVVLERSVETDPSELPKALTAYTDANYPGKSLEEAYRITGSKNLVTYEVMVDGQELVFDAEGKFLSKKEPEQK
jgi:hypothetical protein